MILDDILNLLKEKYKDILVYDTPFIEGVSLDEWRFRNIGAVNSELIVLNKKPDWMIIDFGINSREQTLVTTIIVRFK
jgi:hypothetical protein